MRRRYQLQGGLTVSGVVESEDEKHVRLVDALITMPGGARAYAPLIRLELRREALTKPRQTTLGEHT